MHWQMQDLLTRYGPNTLLVASLGLVVLLALYGPSTTVPGYAEVAPVRIASLESARVTGVTVTPGQIVERGEIIGLLDDGPVLGRMRVLEAERSRTGALLDGQQRDALAALALAQADRDESEARLQAAREGLRISETRLTQRRAQVEAGLATHDSLVSLEAEATILRGEIRQLQARLAAQAELAEMAEEGMDSDDDGPAPAVASQTLALGVVEEELAQLEQRRRGLTLRAPLTARVAHVNYRSGEVLPALDVFAELLPLRTTRVVACVPELMGGRVEAGASVELWPADGETMRGGTVVDVSGLVSEAPDRCKQRPNEIGWVRPVHIEVKGPGLVPGQRFDVNFLPKEGER